jgi:TatD DNase family protein
MIITDTHAHLNDERYKDDLDQVLIRAGAAGLTRIILASASYQDSLDSMRIASEKNSGKLALWCMVGVHPHEAEGYTDEIHGQMHDWLGNRIKHRIVALGEIGLDYFYDLSPRDIQRQVFCRQLDLAFEMDVPIVLHERDAAMDTLDILAAYKNAGKLRTVPGVCHCFSGSVEVAAKLIAYGFYLGFDGPITFKNNRKSPDVIRSIPIDRLLIETDCPYLTPVPFRGQRNEPAYVSYILEKMAELKGETSEKMAEITTENASRLFGLYDLMEE